MTKYKGFTDGAFYASSDYFEEFEDEPRVIKIPRKKQRFDEDGRVVKSKGNRRRRKQDEGEGSAYFESPIQQVSRKPLHL